MPWRRRPLADEAAYRMALERLAVLEQLPLGSSELAGLEGLLDAIEDYERRNRLGDYAPTPHGADAKKNSPH